MGRNVFFPRPLIGKHITSVQYGYEIKYPTSLGIDKTTENGIIVSGIRREEGPECSTNNNELPNYCYQGTGLGIFVDKYSSLDNFIKGFIDNPNNNGRLDKQEKYILDGIEGIKLSVHGSWTDSEFYLILVTKNNKNYEISTINDEIQSKILSTFKFIQ